MIMKHLMSNEEFHQFKKIKTEVTNIFLEVDLCLTRTTTQERTLFVAKSISAKNKNKNIFNLNAKTHNMNEKINT